MSSNYINITCVNIMIPKQEENEYPRKCTQEVLPVHSDLNHGIHGIKMFWYIEVEVTDVGSIHFNESSSIEFNL